MDGEWLLHRGCVSGRVHRTCMPAYCTGRLACVGCDAWGDRVGAAVCGQSGRGVAQDDCIEKCAGQCTSQTMGGVGWLWARVNSLRRNSESYYRGFYCLTTEQPPIPRKTCRWFTKPGCDHSTKSPPRKTTMRAKPQFFAPAACISRKHTAGSQNLPCPIPQKVSALAKPPPPIPQRFSFVNQ